MAYRAATYRVVLVVLVALGALGGWWCGRAAEDDFPAALEAWRSLPEGYLKHIAAVKIANAAPEGTDPEALRELER